MSKTISKFIFGFKAAVPAYGPLAACAFVNQCESLVTIDLKPEQQSTFMVQNVQVTHTNQIFRLLYTVYPKQANAINPVYTSMVDYWLDFTQDHLFQSDFKKLSLYFDILDNHLTLRSFIVGYSLTLADFAVWGALKANAIFNKQLKSGKMATPHLSRWYQFMNSLDSVSSALSLLEKAKDGAKDRTDKGSMEIPLPDAQKGKVVTRFPPEPSGYLHIGHAKAALLNDYFARAYDGKLLVRFDDTNPSKEKMEFEQSIKEDLALLGITPDEVVHTSDHFDKLYEYALVLIKKGLAYVDDTDVDTMRNQRFEGIESKNRNLSIEDNLRLFEEMKQGTPKGFECCLRAKIDMKDKNKCMRDPVIYRCNDTPHHLHGTKWKMYPTYDFACPIVDSLDGVTHALRTIEYRDRNAQYAWFLEALQLRKVHVWDFSRLSFIYTLLSKRKLTWFVDEKLVTGWDDPRFPTVRGIRRRGMTIEALRTYIIAQGASQRELNLEWDKIWALNKKVIDPVSPRHTALNKEGLVPVVVEDSNLQFHTKQVLKHKKNPDLGEKVTNYGKEIFFEQIDCQEMEIDEEVTLMDWGNAIIKEITKKDGVVTGVKIQLHLEGDFKKTKKKLTWLGKGATTATELVDVCLFDYDYLITKKKLEEEDEVTDFLNSVTEIKSVAIGDANLKQLKKGDIIQLERKGYFVCDKPSTEADPVVHLILIPDGKAESVALKAPSKDVAPTSDQPKAASKQEKGKPAVVQKANLHTTSKMYAMKSVYGDILPAPSKTNQMYDVKPIYPKVATKETPTADNKGKKEKAEKKEKKPAQDPQSTTAVSDSLVSKLDIVVGKVLDVKKHPDADTLYIETIDVGEKEPRQVVSGLVKFMKPEDILGKELLVLKNLKPVAMRGIKSFAMVLCASDAEHSKVEFLVPPPGSKPGDKVYFEGHEGEAETELKPKKKVWETVQPDFTTREDLVAVWKDVPFQTSKGLVKAQTLVRANIK